MAGYGTILFFEDVEVIEGLQKQFSLYSENFPKWKHQTSAMHQFAIWTMLRSVDLGSSLQHYNPLIDDAVQKEWNINPRWELVAQMPFGNIVEPAGEKQFNPLSERFLVFK